ncbi:MAG: LamG domain-containing protein, partial [Candidatus Aenigmarchaeota archaeon]|nr:LamG domain-containing protein [Candidatus Aenigmarchaeota archaeon]
SEIIDSEFSWNCLAYDTTSQSDWGDSNFTFSGWDLGTYNKSHFNSIESEFPNNGEDDGITDMGCSVVLFHLNNNEDYGENSSQGGLVYDFSEWGNSGILGNGSADTSPTWTPTGKMGGAYRFDGVNDSISVSSPSHLDSDYTISVWVKPGFDWEYTGGSDYYRIVNTMGTSSWSEGNINLLYDAEFGIIAAYGNGGDIAQDILMNQGQWYHIAVGYNSWDEELNLYVNGWPVDWGYADNSSANETGGDLYIGAGNHGSEEFADASIDEVTIFDCTLSDWDILDLYNRQKDSYPGHTITLTANDTIQELPDNQLDESSTSPMGINMTGNVMLYHLNRDWFLGGYMTGEYYGDTVEDFSGNGYDAYYGGFGNEVSNPGFESGTGTDADSWTEGNNATRASDKARSGTWSMKVTPNEVQTTEQASVPVDADTDYVLSGWIYNDLDDLEYLSAYVDLDDIAEECEFGTDNGNADWEFLSCYFTTGVATTDVDIRLVTDGDNITDNTGSVWFDDISVNLGMPFYAPDGKLNGAYSFNGYDKYIMTGEDNMLDSHQQGAISAWIKPLWQPG